MRVGLVAAIVVCLLAVATTAGAKSKDHTFELRQVLAEVSGTATTGAVCDGCAVLPLAKPQGGVDRLLVGPVRIGGKGVEQVQRRFQNQYVVLFDLDRSALKKFNELAAESYGRQPPRNQVAIVVDGVVVSNPAFQEPKFDGTVQISGDFSRKEIDRLVAKIAAACDC